MMPAQNQLPDAILYIPGLEGQSLDDAALRIASALDISSSTAAAEFPLEAGQDEDYVSEGNSLKTRVRTIRRTEPGKEPQKIVDVYEFSYIDSLVKTHIESNVFVKGLRLLIQLVMNTPRLVGAFFGKKQKTILEKVQYIVAILILSLLVVYLGLLFIAVYDTVREIPQIEAMMSQPSTSPGTATEGSDNTAQTGRDQQQGKGSNLTIFQLVGITIATIEVFYPNLKKSFTDASVRYTSLVEYLSLGARNQVLGGQLLALIDHIAAKGYRHIHIVAYSFGTIIALDNLFPSERMPVKRIREIHTLATIGCPFDLIRVFWPDYFTERVVVANVPKLWINVYSPIDVMASNFRSDSKNAEPQLENAIPSKNDTSVKLVPRMSMPWNTGRPKRTLSFFELLALVGLEAHRSYWENAFESGNTAFSLIIAEIYENDYPLA